MSQWALSCKNLSGFSEADSRRYSMTFAKWPSVIAFNDAYPFTYTLTPSHFLSGLAMLPVGKLHLLAYILQQATRTLY